MSWYGKHIVEATGQIEVLLKEVRECASKLEESAPSASTNSASAPCKQCRYFDLDKGVYTEECYSCKRYQPDLFEQRT